MIYHKPVKKETKYHMTYSSIQYSTDCISQVSAVHSLNDFQTKIIGSKIHTEMCE